MDFDQILDAWKTQDEAPLYGVNRDLLQLVLTNEQAAFRRELRREQWVTWGAGLGLTAWTALWLWILVYMQGPVMQIVGAAVGTTVLVLWVGAFGKSRWSQARRERSFGSTLQDEVRRSLSLVEYQLSRFGRWRDAMLWTAPLIVGAGLLYWLMIEVNLDPGETRWEHVWMIPVLVWGGVFLPLASSRTVAKKLEPRRERLRALLDTLDAE